jgi:hypothetical protein
MAIFRWRAFSRRVPSPALRPVRFLAAASDAFLARAVRSSGVMGLQRALAANLAALAPDLAHGLAEDGTGFCVHEGILATIRKSGNTGLGHRLVAHRTTCQKAHIHSLTLRAANT